MKPMLKKLLLWSLGIVYVKFQRSNTYNLNKNVIEISSRLRDLYFECEEDQEKIIYISSINFESFENFIRYCEILK